MSYLVEEKNEVDGKTHKQSQETQVVEVASQVVLKRKLFNYWQEPTADCFVIAYPQKQFIEDSMSAKSILTKNT